MADLFPLNSKSVEALKNLKKENGTVLLHVIEENIHLLVKTDASIALN